MDYTSVLCLIADVRSAAQDLTDQAEALRFAVEDGDRPEILRQSRLDGTACHIAERVRAVQAEIAALWWGTP